MPLFDIIYRPHDPTLVRLMTCRHCRCQKGFFKNFVAALWPLGEIARGSWSSGTLQDRWGSRDKLALGRWEEVDGKIYVPTVFHLDCFFHNLVFPTFTVKCCVPRDPFHASSCAGHTAWKLNRTALDWGVDINKVLGNGSSHVKLSSNRMEEKW